MKSLTKTTLNAVVAGCMSILAVSATQASEQGKERELKPFVAVGFSKPSIELKSNDATYDYKMTPTLHLGLGQSYQLDENWELQTSASVSYASSEVERQLLGNSETENGRYKETGLWTSATLTRHNLNLIADAKPFITVSAGAIDADYRFGNEHFEDKEIGVKATTGLAFELSQGVSLSIGVGVSSFDEMEPVNRHFND